MKKIFLVSLLFIFANSCNNTSYIKFIKTNFSEESSEPNLHTSDSGEIYLSYISSNLNSNESKLFYSLFDFYNYSWGESNLIVKSSKMFVNWADFPKITANELNGISAHYL